MSSKSQIDPRVQRSRTWMRTALFELIAEKPYDQISITEITDRAGLSRPTFYLHYKSKDEILIAYFDQIFHTIFREYVELWKRGEFNEPAINMAVKVFEKIGEHTDLFSAMIQAGKQNLIAENLKKMGLEYLQQMVIQYQKIHPQPVLELFARYMAGAWLGLIIEWIEQNQPYTPEQMGATFIKITQLPLRAVIHDDLLDDVFDT